MSPSRKTATGHSLWLIPEAVIHDRLQRIILDLAKRFQTPVFDPHITLLGEIPGSPDTILHEIQILAKDFTTLKLKSSMISYQSHFFRSLYMDIDYSVELYGMRSQVEDLFTPNTSLPYHPHLSLLYSKLRERRKANLVRELQDKQIPDLHMDRLVLYCTEGQVRDWYPVQVIRLRK